MDGGAGQKQGIPLGEKLGELAIIHAGVDGPGEGDDAGPDGFSHSPRGDAIAVAMCECGQAVLPGLGQQATDVTNREAQEPRGVRHAEAPLEDLDQDMCSLLLSPAQRDCPPVHSPRVTESLNS